MTNVTTRQPQSEMYPGPCLGVGQEGHGPQAPTKQEAPTSDKNDYQEKRKENTYGIRGYLLSNFSD